AALPALPEPALGALLLGALALAGAAPARRGRGPRGQEYGALRDPEMQKVAMEFSTGGTVLVRAPMGGGSGELAVTAHPAGPARGGQVELGGQREEWRVLRFRPGEAQADSYIQSIARVSVGPGPSARQIGSCLPLVYARSMVAVSLAALAVIGAPLLTPGRPLRVLCIGLGGGALASFLAQAVPHCRVDAVELSPEVLAAAREGMGFAEGPRLRAILGDGAAVARGAAEGAEEDAGAYDAVLIDAADERGRVPDVFLAPDGDFASRALGGPAGAEGRPGGRQPAARGRRGARAGLLGARAGGEGRRDGLLHPGAQPHSGRLRGAGNRQHRCRAAVRRAGRGAEGRAARQAGRGRCGGPGRHLEPVRPGGARGQRAGVTPPRGGRRCGGRAAGAAAVGELLAGQAAAGTRGGARVPSPVEPVRPGGALAVSEWRMAGVSRCGVGLWCVRAPGMSARLDSDYSSSTFVPQCK
ncbi:unnamed protein product, partial [Prorocentrum cordatum]